VWVENIPYNETRNYVQRVLWHSVVYAWLRSAGQPQDTAAWLAPIRALGPTQARLEGN
jgi:soluble lytic murein transglycosylase